MKNLNKQTTTGGSIAVGKQRSYGELVEFLDANWASEHSTEDTLARMKRLDQALGNVSQKLDTVIVGGVNGKSLTIHFASRLLREEGLQVGAFYTPHFLTYNERFYIGNEIISNKTFAELGNDILNTAETLGFTPTSYEVISMMALLFFSSHNADIVLLEADLGGFANTFALCAPKINAITRVSSEDAEFVLDIAKPQITALLTNVRPGTHVVSADQSKLNLQVMHELVAEQGGVWDMPIRKLAPLEYPFEQLHGRCAALAERIASIYVNTFANKDAVVVSKTLLTKQKGQRGRPTLEAKRQSELNPKRTVEQFWKEIHCSVPGRFQVLDKEKPSLLLDNANNLDAFKNLLLGIRLLHYQRPLKGLTLVLGCNNASMDQDAFFKLLRYFFKKTSGSLIICPVEHVAGHPSEPSWDVEQVTNILKGMKIKVRSAKNFKEAFEAAQKSVDERHGLVVISGSPSMVTAYWRYKGVKKL